MSSEPPDDAGARSCSPASRCAMGSLTGSIFTLVFNGRATISEALSRPLSLDTDVPVALLGRTYCGQEATQWVRFNMEHIVYYSYRSHIPRPLRSGADHDAGWGCMIRTGQMMLCEALRRVLPEESALRVTEMFHDAPGAAFGLHRMTEAGEQHLVPAGHWFNPTCCALTIQQLAADSAAVAPYIEVVVGRDGCASRAVIGDAHRRGRQVLLLLPLMLGLDRVPPGYDRAITAMFAVPQSLGIVGGRPKHSLYFVGAQLETLFYLDPHIVQPAFLSPATLHGAVGLRGHCTVAELDPCMLQCYLIRDAVAAAEWEERLAADVDPLSEYPMFSVTGRPRDQDAPGRAAWGTPSPAVVDDCQFSSVSTRSEELLLERAALGGGPAEALLGSPGQRADRPGGDRPPIDDDDL